MGWWAALGFLAAQLAATAGRVVLVAGWLSAGMGLAFEWVTSLAMVAAVQVVVHRAHGPSAGVTAAALVAALQLVLSHASIAAARALHLGDEDLPLPPEHPLGVSIVAGLAAVGTGGWVDGVLDVYLAALGATVAIGVLLGLAAPRAGLEPGHPAVLHPLGFALGAGVQLACAPRVGAGPAFLTAVSLSALSAALLAIGWGVAARRGALEADYAAVGPRCLVYGGLGCLAAGGILAAGIWGG